MTRWRRVNTVAGHLVLGLPALLALPALVKTVTRFGFWTALTSAWLPLLVVNSPWIAWLRYTRRPPSTRRGLLAWSILSGVIVAMLLASLVWLWGVAVLALVLSEAVRLLTARARQGRRPAGSLPARAATEVT